MQSAIAEELAQELEEQLGLYRALIELNREQFTILDQGPGADTDAMVAFVGKKQDLMGRLEASEASIKPKKDAWRTERESVEEGLRKRVDGSLDLLSSTIGELIKMEDEAQERLQSLMNQNTASVENIRKKAQVNRAYAAYGAKKPAPRYIDRNADEA